MKIIVNFTVVFEKEYNEKFAAALIVDIIKTVMGSVFLTGMSIQSYYRYIPVASILLRYKSVLFHMESLNGDDAPSKRVGTSHLNDVGLYRATT